MHHDRWLLSPAEAEIELASIAPFQLGEPQCCHFAFRQDALHLAARAHRFLT